MTQAGSRNNWTPRKCNRNPDEEMLEIDAAITTACPQPRRFVLLPDSPDNPRKHLSYPGSPHSTVEDQAREELRELMGCAGREKDSFPSSGGRPLSSVSTSAGATPNLESWPVSAVSTVPSTPQFPRLEEEEDENDNKVDKENSSATYGGNSKATRQKIFVGGVPQEVDQDEVKNFMSEWGGVKKAWLQKHKETGQVGVNNTQRHRGFGFVIFNDAAAVDKLLGDKLSRYLTLPDGRRIEVKRAVSSADMQKNEDRDVGIGPRQPQQPGLKQPLQSSWSGCQRQQQPGQSGAASSLWLSDPRQSPQHGLGGFTTPDHNSSTSAMLGTPPRVPPMQQGRLTPVPPPPSPWKQSPTPPPPLMSALPLMAGNVVMMPRAPGPTKQTSPGVLPVGNALAPMQCGSVPMRPNAGNTSQQQVSATSPGQPSVAGQVPGHQAPWNNTAMVCSIPWSMVQGSTSVPCPGGPPTGWAAQWEVAIAASQQQQLLQIRPPQHQSPQQQSRELLQIQEDQLLQLEYHPQHQQQANESQSSSHAAQVQVPNRPQTPITPGSPQQMWQLEQALRQAMPDHYDE